MYWTPWVSSKGGSATRYLGRALLPLRLLGVCPLEIRKDRVYLPTVNISYCLLLIVSVTGLTVFLSIDLHTVLKVEWALKAAILVISLINFTWCHSLVSRILADFSSAEYMLGGGVFIRYRLPSLVSTVLAALVTALSAFIRFIIVAEAIWTKFLWECLLIVMVSSVVIGFKVFLSVPLSLLEAMINQLNGGTANHTRRIVKNPNKNQIDRILPQFCKFEGGLGISEGEVIWLCLGQESVCNSCSQLNKFYSLQLLLLGVEGTARLVISTFYLSNSRSLPVALSSSLACLSCLLLLHSLINMIVKLTKKSEEFNAVLYYKIMNDRTGLFNNRKLLLHLSKRFRIVFTACDLFNFDYSFMQKMIAMGVSYMVILSQFTGLTET